MIRLALHGGAGDPAAPGFDASEQRAALRRFAEAGQTWLLAGASAVEVVEGVVGLLEDCPLFNAGIGAVLNAQGQPELDAAVMDGRSRAFGGVAGVSGVRSPVRLARTLMEQGPHVLMFGSGAEAYGREKGLEAVEPGFFVTAERLRQLAEAKQHDVIALDHDSAFGTVGAVARDAKGHLAAATSTGGLTNKRPGRIGDTPVPGAGTYADDRSLAVSCTGTGESFLRVGFGLQVHGRMRYGGATLSEACEAALEDVRACAGRGGCIAIGHDGALALPFNSKVMYRAWIDADGCVKVAVGRNDGA